MKEKKAIIKCKKGRKAIIKWNITYRRNNELYILKGKDIEDSLCVLQQIHYETDTMEMY